MTSCLATQCFAQGTEGSIVGVVRDALGGVIPGVDITIRNEGTGISRPLRTDEAGRYSAPALSVGTYSVTAELAGFKTFVQTGIRLDVSDRLRVDITLQIGDVAETVTISSGAAELQTETGEMSNLIEGSQITQLAINGRNFISLAGLTTGAANFLSDEVRIGAIAGHTGG
ncbi:MAG: carboxypeptidase-like regulatory domain-containing protein, partial [Acidobacteriota bacterium]